VFEYGKLYGLFAKNPNKTDLIDLEEHVVKALGVLIEFLPESSDYSFRIRKNIGSTGTLVIKKDSSREEGFSFSPGRDFVFVNIERE